MKKVAEVWQKFWWCFDRYALDVAGVLSLVCLVLWLYSGIRYGIWW